MTITPLQADYQTLLVSQEERVGIVQLNRPQALNAINPELRLELITAMDAFDRDEDIGCMVLTGGPKEAVLHALFHGRSKRRDASIHGKTACGMEASVIQYEP